MAEGVIAITSDRISELPDPLLHHILSLVPVKDAARASVLSKRWNNIWVNLPYLNFHKGLFNGNLTSLRDRKKERRLMKKNRHLLDVANKIILSRHQKQVASIEKFCIYIDKYWMPQEELDLLYDKDKTTTLEFMLESWMPCLAKRSLKELDLTIGFGRLHYNLPSAFLSARSLTVLSLSRFSLISLSSFDIKFSSLRELVFTTVYLEDGIMQKFITGSPLMERLQLVCCTGLKSLYVTGLAELKLLKVNYVWDLEILEIESPGLEVLEIWSPSPSCKFRMSSSACIKSLQISGDFMPEKWFCPLISKPLALEHLTLFSIGALESIKIASDTLKTLELHGLDNLAEAVINVPNLEKFNVITKTLPTILLTSLPTVEITLEFYLPAIDDLWHGELAKFLGYFAGFHDVNIFGQRYELVIIPKEKRDSMVSPLHGTRNLVVSVPGSNFVAVALVELVEYLIWLSPEAESLSLTTGNPAYWVKPHTELKFCCERNACEDYSSSPSCTVECWRHCLTDVRLKKFEDVEEDFEKPKSLVLEFVQNLKV